METSYDVNDDAKKGDRSDMADDQDGHDNGKRKRRRRSGADHAVTDDLINKVVLSMYLHEGKPSCRPIREVVRERGITPQLVSACLERAHEKGMISVSVSLPYEVTQAHILSEDLRRRYGLKQVILVAGNTAMLGKLTVDERRRVHSNVIRAMMPHVAALLDGVIGAAADAGRDCHVSVAWGRTMSMFADRLQESMRPRAWSRLRVLPLLGPTAWAKTDPVEASIIAMRVASTYGGMWGQFPGPAFVRAEDFGRWLALPEVHEALRLLRESHCVITSLGPIPPKGDLIDVTLSNDQAMSDTLAEAARLAGAIGEINYWAFTVEGRPVETAYRALGLGFDGLQALSADPERSVILICGGDRHRISALRGALAARLCNVLVSDTVTARELLGEPQPGVMTEARQG